MSEKPPHKPLDVKSDRADLNDQIHAATANQGEVTPQDYPAEERDSQIEAATGRPAGKDKKAERPS